MKNLLFKSFALLFVTVLVPSASVAQTAYPTEPITLIVPFAAGGGVDFAARTIGAELSDALGQPVLVENRTGADGIVGTLVVAGAKPDGHTLGLTIQAAMAFNPSIYTAANYDPIEDFEHIALVARSRFLLMVNPEFKVDTFKEFADYARAHPGQVNYATASTSGLVVAKLLEKVAGFEMNTIPYSGSGAARTDLLAGRVDTMISNPVAVLPALQAGELRPLAIMSADRYTFLPDVPTLAEQGYPDFDVTGWYGVVAPGGTPTKIVDRLNREIVAILQRPSVQETLQKAGVEAVTEAVSPAEHRRFVQQEVAFWSEVIRGAGIMPK